MSEVVERIARALAATRVYDGYNAETRARVIEREMHAARRDVRFVIKAMREPSAKQLASAAMSAVHADASEEDKRAAGAVLELLPPTGHPLARTVVAEIARDYRAMIDAALKDAP